MYDLTKPEEKALLERHVELVSQGFPVDHSRHAILDRSFAMANIIKKGKSKAEEDCNERIKK